jgi:hypothetical protein
LSHINPIQESSRYIFHFDVIHCLRASLYTSLFSSGFEKTIFFKLTFLLCVPNRTMCEGAEWIHLAHDRI